MILVYKLTSILSLLLLLSVANASSIDLHKGLGQVIKSVTPSMVAIAGSKRITSSNEAYTPMNSATEQMGYSIGSGVIVDSDRGLILTNAHVISDVDEIEVLLHDQRKYDAKVLGADKESDVGLLQINAKNLQAIEFADSDSNFWHCKCSWA